MNSASRARHFAGALSALLRPSHPAKRLALGGTLGEISEVRMLSNNKQIGSTNDLTTPTTAPHQEWRKQQLDRLEKKFDSNIKLYPDPLEISSDESLQPHWKNMESRVKNRRPKTAAQNGGKTGRVNVKKTDEEIWLREGLYNDSTDKKEG